MSLFHAITIGFLIGLIPFLDQSLNRAVEDKSEEINLTLDQPDQVWITQFENNQIRLNY